MAINIKSLKPQIGVLRIHHPFLTTKTGNMLKKTYTNDKGELIEFEVEEEVPLTEFELPDGTKGPLELYVIGRNSRQWVDFQNKIFEWQMTSEVRNDQTWVAQIKKETPELLASMITGWLDNGALTTPYSKEEALELITDPENDWIARQIDAFIKEESNFFL